MRNREPHENEGMYRNYFCKGYQTFFDQWYELIMQLGAMVKK